MDDVIVPTPRQLEVSAELEGADVYRWLQATDWQASWKTAAGTLFIASPGALSISTTAGRVEFYLGGSEERPDSIRAAERLLAALRELPESRLLLNCHLQVRVRRRG